MHLVSAVFDSVLSKSPDLFPEETARYYRQVLRLIGLTHDLGHAPFSYASEYLFAEGRTHEDYTREILLHTKIADCIAAIGKKMQNEIGSEYEIDAELIWMIYEGKDILKPQYKLPDFKFLKSFMDGELDCDKMDYLLRDSYYCGVRYGQFDLNRLVNSFMAFQDEKESALLLGIERGGIHAVEEFVLARYFMFLQVYFHKTRRLFDRRLTDCLAGLLPAGTLPLDINEYLRWDDAKVMEEAERQKDAKCVKAFLDRSTMSCVYSTNVHLDKTGERLFRILERQVKELLKSDGVPDDELSQYIWVDKPSKAVHKISEEALSERGIPVISKYQEEPTSILEESLLLHSMKKSIEIQRLYVSDPYKDKALELIKGLLKEETDK